MCQSSGDSREYFESRQIQSKVAIQGSVVQLRSLSAADSQKIGFKIFLNITPTVTNWTADNKQFSLVFEGNPLTDFVELPDDGKAQDELWYSNILCGIIRGALEMVRTLSTIPETDTDDLKVQMQVEAHYVSDMLRGSDTTEMRVTLLRYIEYDMPPDFE